MRRRPFQQLAAGAALPMLALVYVQTPERALGNAFFVVIPLAAAFLARVPPAAAWAAAITNGLVTARIGLSSELLPSSAVSLPRRRLPRRGHSGRTCARAIGRDTPARCR